MISYKSWLKRFVCFRGGASQSRRVSSLTPRVRYFFSIFFVNKTGRISIENWLLLYQLEKTVISEISTFSTFHKLSGFVTERRRIPRVTLLTIENPI